MPLDRTESLLSKELSSLDRQGVRKGREAIVAGVIFADRNRGPRYLLEGEGDRLFLRMNSNGYLGMALHREVIAAAEGAANTFGIGPSAVRFISGTYSPHIELERQLAEFHGREAGMIFNSAYSAMMGLLPPLVTSETTVISDELNHNCIINSMRLANPRQKLIYPHLDIDQLEVNLQQAAKNSRRAIVITDGIFSMRGDHVPLAAIVDMAGRYDDQFSENIIVIVDDSHGVGAFGVTGRGTEEYTKSENVDLLVGTLGKAIGVNGGYVVSSQIVINYLREKAPFYIYSNPISPGEAAAALKALEILRSNEGVALLKHLREMTARFEQGIIDLDFETIPGDHPIAPLMLRDTDRTIALENYLKSQGILATALKFPVVPHGDEEIRFQICANHTKSDIDEVLSALADFKNISYS